MNTILDYATILQFLAACMNFIQFRRRLRNAAADRIDAELFQVTQNMNQLKFLS